VLKGLAALDVSCSQPNLGIASPARPLDAVWFNDGLRGLRQAASFTTQIWPEAAETLARGVSPGMRGLGAAPTHAKYRHQLGSRVRLSIKSERAGYLLLLDEGPEGIVYCLCPSLFAADSHIGIGRMVLPQPDSPFDSFLITGRPGREQLLAIISDEPLAVNWMAADPSEPARILESRDIRDLLDKLRVLPLDSWLGLATYFDVIA
jgi:hypothetical protein